MPYLGAIAALAVLVLLLYNSLVAKRNAVENAFATIDVYLKKRYDLIPGLVAVVKGYAQHESATLAKVAELRTRALAGGLTSEVRVGLDNELSAGLTRLLATAEAYPELKANEHFGQLQRALCEIEEQLAAARRAFNAGVTEYNTAIEVFPTNLLAGPLGFLRRTWLATPPAEQGPVNVGGLLGQ